CIRRHGFGIGHRYRCCYVAVRDVCSMQSQRMIGWRTSITWKVDRNGEIGKWCDLEVYGIADRESARRYRETRTAAERQSTIRALQNCAAAFVDRNVCGADVDRLRVEHVRQFHAHTRTTQAGPDDHAHGLICKCRRKTGWWRTASTSDWRRHKLLSCSPSRYPMFASIARAAALSQGKRCHETKARRERRQRAHSNPPCGHLISSRTSKRRLLEACGQAPPTLRFQTRGRVCLDRQRADRQGCSTARS